LAQCVAFLYWSPQTDNPGATIVHDEHHRSPQWELEHLVSIAVGTVDDVTKEIGSTFLLALVDPRAAVDPER